MERTRKPLGGRAYGRIPHLLGSRRGPADRGVEEGQHRICTERARDKHDHIIVQEKLDGSCVAVSRLGGAIVPLIRAGYRADESHYPQHHLFAQWVYANQDRFLALLNEGERVVGEWLAQAHGTRYDLTHEPFVVFDFFDCEGTRFLYDDFLFKLDVSGSDFIAPYLIHRGGPLSVQAAMEALGEYGKHGALDPVEGAVWRVEREWKVDFLAKCVRADKEDGCYLESVTGKPPVWNWLPERWGAR